MSELVLLGKVLQICRLGGTDSLGNSTTKNI